MITLETLCCCVLAYTYMIRRTVAFTNALNQRLKMLAKEKDKNFSEIVRDLLARALETEKEARLQRMYKAFDSLDGIGDNSITDASITINETLYGEHGAWRAKDE